MGEILDGGVSSELGSRHEFLYHYCDNKLNAIRYMDPKTFEVWKMHFFKANWDNGTDFCESHLICHCYGDYVTYYDVL